MSMLIVLSIIALAMALSWPLVRINIAVCVKYSIYDYPGQHKRHKRPTPNLGGVSLLFAVWGAIGIIMLISPRRLAEIEAFLPYLISGSVIVAMVGLIDDLSPLPAWPKLFAEIITGVILYYGGISIETVSIPGWGAINLNGFSIVLTILWVVGLTNAINLIDGLDGLAPGVSAIAYATMGIIGLIYKVESIATLSFIWLGALIVFWLYNRYPAKIFLGDSGALLIGFFFAVISLMAPIKSYAIAALYIPLIALGVPLLESGSSLIRRLAAGKSVTKADRRHIFHYLRYAGLSRGKIVNIFYLSGAIFGALSIMMLFYSRILVLTILLLFMVVIFIIYFILISKIRRG
jgi:UDP-GlcNAc:undecaprenyl-phosphate GlcNAc-1-phosphate transferase